MKKKKKKNSGGVGEEFIFKSVKCYLQNCSPVKEKIKKMYMLKLVNNIME